MPAQPNQSLIEGLRVLQTLVSHEGSIGSRQMAALLGLEPTRANRLLGTLVSVGLAQQGADRKYRPGPGVHVLAAQSLHGSHLLGAALPHLETLGGLGLNVTLGVLWQRQISFLFRSRVGMASADCIGNWPSEAAGDSSAGVFLLAQSALNDEEIALLQSETKSSRDLKQLLDSTREEGWSRLVFRNGDISLGVGIGTPALAGLAASGRFSPDEETRALEALQNAAAQITEKMARIERR